MNTDRMTTYERADGGLIYDEYDFVTQLEWFDDEPMELTKKVWRLESVETMTVNERELDDEDEDE